MQRHLEFRNPFCVVIIDQSRRAIRLVRATATRRGFFESVFASHGSSQLPFLSDSAITALAPMISSLRTSRCPVTRQWFASNPYECIFVIRPSGCLPPVECCRGTRPSQAAKSRPVLKIVSGGQKAWTAKAPSHRLQSKRLPGSACGSIPGIVCSHLDSAFCSTRRLIFTSRKPISI